MGISFIKNPSENSTLGIWHITESAEELFKKVVLSSTDSEILKTKRNDSRKKEWLACRNLAKALLQEDFAIQYDRNGKPFLESNSHQISMSHSGDYACVYLDKLNPVGVDIQKLKVSVKAGSAYFVNESEMEWVNCDNNKILHIIWSAKETVFKYFGNNDLDMKKDITVNPFKSNENGIIEVNNSNHLPIKTILVYYQFFDGYVLTYTI